jgi:hypothetical protein
VSLTGAAKAAGFARWTGLAWTEEGGARVRLALWDRCRRTDLKTVPFPEGTWSARGLGVGDAAGGVCVLGYQSTTPRGYHVLCADVRR